jgi:hypothetical protein
LAGGLAAEYAAHATVRLQDDCNGEHNRQDDQSYIEISLHGGYPVLSSGFTGRRL